MGLCEGMYNEGNPGRTATFSKLCLSANMVADGVNDLAKDKHCQLKEKCGCMVTKQTNAHKCRKVSYKLL
jgi:hypothetical protein